MNLFDIRSVTFDEPIEMLYACHGKVRNFCEQIDRLPGYLAENGYNKAVAQAVRQIRHYFTIAADLHHQDEEHDFFPLLLQYRPQARETIEELERQHQHLHQIWLDVEEELEKLQSAPEYTPDTGRLKTFSAAYQQHLLLEEPLFEQGKQAIPAAELTAIGSLMSRRRQTAR